MKIAPNAVDEKERIKKLKSYGILDTLPEQSYDDLTFIASKICGTPIALVSLVDESRQWFKSRVGLDAEETPRDVAFCSHAILQDQVFEISDSLKDERFHDNPLAVGAPHVRFYAGAPLKTQEGHNIGTLCVIDHVPRELNEGQKNSLEALARQVVSLLELKTSQIAAQKASEAKSQFLANMSHEIRTPLGGVLSFTDLLLEMDLSTDILNYVTDIKGCCDNLLVIVNDILDNAKIEAGKLELHFAPVNLSETLNGTVSVFKASAQAKGISLKTANSLTNIHWIEGDAVRIRQVLLNLVGNAVKFTHEGEVKITLTLEELSESEKAVVKMSVEDSGVGISKNAESKIFEMFEQGDNTTTRNYGGTGLGLPICSKLAKMMGGEVKFSSTENVGSLFEFVFPCTTLPNYSLDESKNCELDQKYDFSNLKILVAEDSEINQKLIKKMLVKIGVGGIDLVANGVECLQKCQEEQYDMILMDVQMPLMDGLQATREIRQLLKKAPLIAGLSANAFQEDRETAFEHGMDFYLEKPVNLKRLEDLISKILKK